MVTLNDEVFQGRFWETKTRSGVVLDESSYLLMAIFADFGAKVFSDLKKRERLEADLYTAYRLPFTSC
jgi:hypothetical protein